MEGVETGGGIAGAGAGMADSAGGVAGAIALGGSVCGPAGGGEDATGGAEPHPLIIRLTPTMPIAKQPPRKIFIFKPTVCDDLSSVCSV